MTDLTRPQERKLASLARRAGVCLNWGDNLSSSFQLYAMPDGSGLLVHHESGGRASEQGPWTQTWVEILSADQLQKEEDHPR